MQALIKFLERTQDGVVCRFGPCLLDAKNCPRALQRSSLRCSDIIVSQVCV